MSVRKECLVTYFVCVCYSCVALFFEWNKEILDIKYCKSGNNWLAGKYGQLEKVNWLPQKL